MSEPRVKSNSLSPNYECILASTPEFDKTVQLWNLETNKPIGTSLHHEDYVNCTTFSADGRFLFTICINGYIYRWDLSAIVKEASLHLDIVNATPRPAPKMKGVPRIPAGFFDDALREANYVASYAFVYPNPMSYIATLHQHHVNAPSVLFAHFGTAPS
jgi:WD40 repeat protein